MSPQVDIVLVLMGLSMSIIMMNILIGVLAESYNRGVLALTILAKSPRIVKRLSILSGWEHRERLFLLERSRLVLHHFTINSAWDKCPCTCVKRRVQSEGGAHHASCWQYCLLSCLGLETKRELQDLDGIRDCSRGVVCQRAGSLHLG